MSLGKQILLTSVRNSAWANRNLLDGCVTLTAEELELDFRISHASIISNYATFTMPKGSGWIVREPRQTCEPGGYRRVPRLSSPL